MNNLPVTEPEPALWDTHNEWQDLNRTFVPASPEPGSTHFHVPYGSDQAKDFAAWWQEQTHTQYATT